jgi:hemoglobin
MYRFAAGTIQDSMLRIVLCLCLVACGGSKSTKPTAPADNRSLFERLGGLPAITAVVDDFVATTGSDPRIKTLFMNIDVPRIKKMMIEDICERTGGPCKYAGKSMKESHKDMKLKPEDFEVFMEDLEKTLDKFKVPAREKSEVLADFRSRQAEVMNASAPAR